MNSLQSHSYLLFKHRRIASGTFSERIACDDEFSREIARPLFNVGLIIAAITERTEYDSKLAGIEGRKDNNFTLLLQGRMDITLNDLQTVIGPGELVWAPVGTRFRRAAKGPVWWLYLQFSDSSHWEPLKKLGPYIRDYGDTALTFLHLRRILDAKNRGRHHDTTLARESAHYLERLLSHEMAAVDHGISPHISKLEALMGEIVRRPQIPWTIRSMTELTSLSKSHLSELFKRHYGLSPMESVIKQRMVQAADLLTRKNKSVQDTATDVGYQSVCSFTRLFTRHVGMSPRDYRKKSTMPCHHYPLHTRMHTGSSCPTVRASCD